MTPDKRASRRHFLAGELAGMFAEVVDAAADRLAASQAQRSDGAAVQLVRVSRRAMAALFEVQFSAARYPHGTDTALEALELLEPLEAALSLFRPDSAVNDLNRHAAFEPVRLDATLFELIRLGLEIWRQTAGAFDLTATPLWELWGFACRAARVPAADEIQAALRQVGSRFVELDCQAQTVRFLKEGIRLSFASLGKGYALDRCAERLLAGGVADFLLHGGYSSVVARGTLAGDLPHWPAAGEKGDSTGHRGGASRADSVGPGACLPDGPTCPPSASAGECFAQRGGWIVGVRHPLRCGRRVAEIRLCDTALSTSGSGVQALLYRGRRYGHIIDPRTGWPAQGVLSVTVVAPSAVLAEALSTAFFVLGPEQSAQYCAEYRDVGAVFVCPSRRPGGIDVQVFGLDQQQVRLLA